MRSRSRRKPSKDWRGHSGQAEGHVATWQEKVERLPKPTEKPPIAAGSDGRLDKAEAKIRFLEAA